MEGSEHKENYFLEDHALRQALPSDQGATSDSSRVISAQFEQILDSLPFYVILVDTDHTIQFANSAVRRTAGLTLHEMQGQSCPQIIHGREHYPGCPVEQAIRGGPTEQEHFATEHGRWLLTCAYPTGAKTSEGLDLYFHTVRDITDQKNAQRALEISENKYRRLFEEMEDAIFVVSTAGQVQEMNRAGLELFRVSSRDEMSRFNLFTDLRLLDCDWTAFTAAMDDRGRVVNYEISFYARGDTTKVVSINASMERDVRSGEGVIRGIARDITRNRQLEQQTITDEMTTLYNRAFFDACLEGKVEQARRAGLSVLFFDIDDFKDYNDAYGHQEGDYVLRRVAQAMISALRDEDVAGRYGGEEFTVIVACGAQAAAQAAERVRSAVETNCSPQADERIKRSVTVSVGVATLGDDASTSGALVNIADTRMYNAKRLGKNRVAVGETPVS